MSEAEKLELSLLSLSNYIFNRTQEIQKKVYPDNLSYEYGYIISGEECRSKTEGVFVAGDCRTKQVRQIATAVSDGAVAAVNACKYIDSLE